LQRQGMAGKAKAEDEEGISGYEKRMLERLS
jgi:hypothetical protein